MPNLAHESVPVGNDESANQVVKPWGEPIQFAFTPRDHVDVATNLGILDLERAAKITGARFSILTGVGARLERALINFCLDLHTKQHGYTEVLPPLIVNTRRCSALANYRSLKQICLSSRTSASLLIPTAEVPVTNIYPGEILDTAQLPVKWRLTRPVPFRGRQLWPRYPRSHQPASV